MTIENIHPDKIIVHELSKDPLTRDISISYGDKLEVLFGKNLQYFKEKLNTVLGHNSKSIELKIANTGFDSCLQIAKNVIDYDTDLFIKESGKFADALSPIIKKKGSVPGGVLIIFTGTAFIPKKRIIGIIKAEVHDGFARDKESGNLSFISNLLLTPNTKLYKIGIFLEENGAENKWRAFVHDEKITSNYKLAAAEYFYHDFLGCDFLEENAILTRDFYIETNSFISALSCDIEDKIKLNTSLITYLHSNENTIQLTKFCTNYLDEELHDDYYDYMESKKITSAAIVKDLEFVAKSIDYRKITFSDNVKMTVPSTVFDDLVRIDTIEGSGSNGDEEKWTQIIIKGQILKQQ